MSAYYDPEATSTERRFWAKVHRAPAGCWQWTGALTRWGYASFWNDGKNHRAHRWLFQRLRGAVPVGLQLDHLCRNRACVNPEHLEVVTASVNVFRGNHWERRRTHCPAGHEYTRANTYRRKNGSRYCRACGAERQRRRHAN